MLGELERLHEALATQDNAITSNPIFLVQQKRRHIGFDAAYEEDEDRLIWINGAAEEEVTRVSDPARFACFQAGNFDGEEAEDWEVFGFTDSWEFVQPFLTREAAEEFRRREAHNLGETRIYVESGHRNPEWKRLRALFGGELLAQARLARELTVLLCTEDGQDPVERAKALQSERLILLHKRETLVGYVESLRAALAEKDAEIERIRAEVEGDNGLRASKEAGWALAKARLDESDTTRSALRQEVNAHGNTLNTLATYQEETARLRAQVADLQEQASMACIEPRDDCDCHGCSYAAEVHAKGETKA